LNTVDFMPGIPPSSIPDILKKFGAKTKKIKDHNLIKNVEEMSTFDFSAGGGLGTVTTSRYVMKTLSLGSL